MLRVTRAFRRMRSPAAATHVGAFVAGAALATAALAHAMPSARDRDTGVATLAKALERIERHYVGEVSTEEVVHAAVEGMIDPLDGGSAFLDPSSYRRLVEDTDGRHSGVGLSLGRGDDAPVIERVIPGSPADRAGLEPGDEVRAVDGRRADELDGDLPRRFEGLLRGEAETRVELQLFRDRRARALELVREPVSPPSVEWAVASASGGDIGLVAIERFHDNTPDEVAEALSALARRGDPGGVVLDLRGNPGGLFDAAIRVADLFLDAGTIVTIRGRGGAVLSRWEAEEAGAFNELPVVAVIDGETASAAEILAGALGDHDRAVLAGTASYGKGSVQTLYDLPDGSGLRLTTSHYFTPGERRIGDGGLGPDVRLDDLSAASGGGGLAGAWRDDDALVWAVEALGSGEGARGQVRTQEARAD